VDETAMPQVLYFYNSKLLFLLSFICLLKQTEAKFIVTDINSTVLFIPFNHCIMRTMNLRCMEPLNNFGGNH
jgi:hypothetical protein